MKLLLSSTLVLSLMVVPEVSVKAQPGPVPEASKPNPETVANARKAFLAGKIAHDGKKYKLAIKKYTEAYELYPQPLFLYNIAQVKRLDGDLEGALFYYEKYLNEDPKGRGAKNSRQIVGELRAQIAQQKAVAEAVAKAEARVEADAKAKADADAKAEADAKAKAEAEAQAALITNPDLPPVKDSGSGLKIAGLSTAGVGLLSLGVSALFANSAQSKQDEIANFSGTWTTREQKLYDEGETANRWAIISAGVGGTAIVSGALLYLLGSRKSSRADSLSVIPMPVRGSASIGLHTRF